jgi:hypothetical protein
MIFAADASEAHRVATARDPNREVQVERVPRCGLEQYDRETPVSKQSKQTEETTSRELLVFIR